MQQVRIGVFDFYCCAFAFGICDRSLAAWNALGDQAFFDLLELVAIAGVFTILLPFLNPRWK